jgi:predicted enzyme related to lactoylglutathione lyase
VSELLVARLPAWSHGDQGDRRAVAAAVTIQGYHRRVVELSLVEFPADDPERARRFWEGFVGVPFAEREEGEGRGRQTREGGVALGLHERGPGPGDRFSLPYFAVADVAEALARVQELGGEVVHPGERWAICRDSEGSPFGLGNVGVPDNRRAAQGRPSTKADDVG